VELSAGVEYALRDYLRGAFKVADDQWPYRHDPDDPLSNTTGKFFALNGNDNTAAGSSLYQVLQNPAVRAAVNALGWWTTSEGKTALLQ
jgi:hypothetical protein